MIAKITCFKVKESVIDEVGKMMDKAGYKKHIKGSVFLKVNLLSDQVVPGQCTSPYVLEGVIKKLREDGFKEIYAGDANVATSKQVMTAARKWGHLDVCRRYGVMFVNLSNEKRKKVDSEAFGRVGIPEILLNVNSIVTLPVLKTHNVAKFTCALKNQWGCLPEIRHTYHMKLDRCIPEINRILKPKFVVVDATVCMEGNGPRTGEPRIMDAIFASNDLVAMDSFCCELIGAGEVDYIKNAETAGLGSMNYKISGEKIEKVKFKPALANKHPIVAIELIMRRIPLLNWLLFKTAFFKIPAFFASKYNSFVWYHLKGKRYARELVNKSKVYNKEFSNLIQ